MESAIDSKLARTWLAVLALAMLLLGGCERRPVGAGPSGPDGPTSMTPGPALAPHPATDPAALAVGETRTYDVTGSALAKGVVVGRPQVFDNLTVFPILAKEQPNIGPVMSLDAALEAGKAEVRELGAGAPPDQRAPVQQVQAPQQAPQYAQQPAQPSSGSMPQRQAALPRSTNAPIQQVANLGGSAEVGTLVIENKGTIPIFVLAGTVVKGGKQDRQIGQDFIVPPLSQVPVDAFCVEQGRWTATRAGEATGGKFTTLKQLATSKVRTAGQYKGNQGEVWQQVAAVNKAHNKRSASDTLMATLDDPEVSRKRQALAGKVVRHLDAVSPRGAVVGYAYAVDGRIKGARWFVNHEVFALFRETLVNTSAVDALTAQGGRPPKAPPPVAAHAVASFVEEVDKAEDKKIRDTAGANVNQYQESDHAYGSSTILKRKAAPPMPMSSDYVAK